MRALWIPVVFVLALPGCSVMEPRSRPAPVSEAGEKSPASSVLQSGPSGAAVEERTEEVEVYAYRSPATPRYQSGRPVLALLDRAEAQRAAGDLAGAAATLERALRIEPRNPHLWNRLARIRLQQRQYSQAANLAAKSNALAGDALALKRDNGSIITMSRKATGQ